MSNVHPSSKGLRELADFLDERAAEGIELMQPVVLFMSHLYDDKNVQRAACIAVSQTLNVPIQPPADANLFSDIQLCGKFTNLDALFNFRASLVCEQVEEMRPVKVWKCDGVEVSQ